MVVHCVPETVNNFFLDVRSGLRRLRRAWRMALTCVAFLSVAIAATTTVFSFVNAALLRPLPYPQADRLVAITEDNGELPYSRILVSAPVLAALRSGTTSFDYVGAYGDDAALVRVGETVQPMFVTAVDSGVLPTLRVSPQLGSSFTAAHHASVAKVTLVSDAFWRTHLGGSPDAIGKTIRVNDTTYQVLGVMPLEFAFSGRGDADLWIPLNEQQSRWFPGQQPWFSVIARLRTGVAHASARQELSVIEARLRQDDPGHWRRMRIVMRDDAIFRVSRMWSPVLFVFLGGAAAVLLIACVNVGTLLSMRASDQRASIAVRAAMGAGPSRLVAHNLVESLLLVVASAVLGLILSTGLVPLVERLAVLQRMPHWFRTDMDYRVFLFGTALAALAVVLVGLRAARQSLTFDVANTLRRSGDGGATAGDVSATAARGVILQVALSVMLAVASTLLAVTYHRVTTVDAGYARDKMATLHAFIDARVVTAEEDRWLRMRELAGSVRRLAGVEEVSLRGELVNYRGTSDDELKDADVFGDLGGRPAEHPGWMLAQKAVVEPNYFTTLKIPVLRGRTFSGAESNSSATQVILSVTAAGMLWPGQEAVGRVMRIGSNGPRLTVIGVVGDVRRSGMGPSGMGVWPIPLLYLSSHQAVATTPVLHARVRGNADAIRSQAGAEVLRLLGATPFMLRTPEMEQDELVVLLRTSGVLFGASAFIACFLAALGAYAVVRYRGQQRQREIGIRMSLGATGSQIRWDVARECLIHGGAGLVAGLVASALLAQLMRSAIWGVSRFSPVVYASVAVAMVLLVGFAGYTASRRAGQVDPASIMRN